MLLRLRVTQSLSPHSTPSPDLTPLRQPSRPLCAADKSKGHPYMHSVLSHMLSPQPWQRSLPMQRAAVNTETPNWRVLRTTRVPSLRWGISIIAFKAQWAPWRGDRKNLGARRQKRVFWSYSVWTLCVVTGKVPSRFLVRCQACSGRKVTSDAVNLARNPRLKSSWPLWGPLDLNRLNPSQMRTHISEGY